MNAKYFNITEQTFIFGSKRFNQGRKLILTFIGGVGHALR